MRVRTQAWIWGATTGGVWVPFFSFRKQPGSHDANQVTTGDHIDFAHTAVRVEQTQFVAYAAGKIDDTIVI